MVCRDWGCHVKDCIGVGSPNYFIECVGLSESRYLSRMRVVEWDVVKFIYTGSVLVMMGAHFLDVRYDRVLEMLSNQSLDVLPYSVRPSVRLAS